MADRRPLRVAFVVDVLLVGGAERAVVQYANAVAADGGAALVVATRRGGPLVDELDPAVRVEVLDKSRSFDPQSWRRLGAVLAAHRTEVVHVNGTAVIGVAAATWRSPLPVVWHYHSGGMPTRKVALALRPALRRVDVVAAADPVSARHVLAQLGVDRPVQPLMNPLAFRPLAPSPDPSGSVRVVSVANMKEPKDPITLVRAVRALVEEGEDLSVELVGVEYDAGLAQRVRDEISAAGLEATIKVPGPTSDVASLLASADVGVLSSRSEALPTVLLEYGAAGLGVIAPEVGRVPWLLEGGHAGLLFQPGDVEGLRDGLRTLVQSPDERRRLGRRLQVRVERITDPDAIFTSLCHIHDLALRSGPAASGRPSTTVAREPGADR